MSRLSRFIHFYTDEDEGNGGGGDPGILKTVSGALLHITDALAKPAKKFTATLEPKQDLHGQDAPYPAGGGKNKLNISESAMTSSGYNRMFPITLSEGTYTLSIQNAFGSSKHGKVSLFDSNGTTILQIAESYSFGGNDLTPKTFALTSEQASSVDRIVFLFSDSDTTYSDIAVAKLMIESGSSATAYAPYSNICPITGHTGANVYRSGADTSNPTTIPITFPDAAGTVFGGTLTLEDGVWKLTVTHKYYTNAGTGNWGAITSGGARYFIGGISYDAKDVSTNGWSNIGNLVSNFYADGIVVGSNGRINLCENLYNSFASVDDLKTYLALNPLQLVYELATPIEYTLTETQALTLLEGTNNVWCDSSDSLELQYYAKAEETTP